MDTKVLKRYARALGGAGAKDREATEKMRQQAMTACLCDAHPDIAIDGRTFCFTGKSGRMRRDMIAQVVTMLGGKFRDGVSGKTDYLVVGSRGSSAWAYAAFGRKLARAMALRKAGGGIRIVREDDFWRACG